MQKIQKTYQIIYINFSPLITYLAHQLHSMVESLQKFSLVADLIVDGCNAYQRLCLVPEFEKYKGLTVKVKTKYLLTNWFSGYQF